MNRRQIEDAFEMLDSAIRKVHACIKLQQYGCGPDEGKIVANETGYLRLGVEFR